MTPVSHVAIHAWSAMAQLTPEERQAAHKRVEVEIETLLTRRPDRVLVNRSPWLTMAATGPCR
jgi:hypothetical protein